MTRFSTSTSTSTSAFTFPFIDARVTGQLSAAPQDVMLDEWQQAGLPLPSVVRLHKVATLQRKLVDKKLGRLTPGDWSRVVLTLRQTCRSF